MIYANPSPLKMWVQGGVTWPLEALAVAPFRREFGNPSLPRAPTTDVWIRRERVTNRVNDI